MKTITIGAAPKKQVTVSCSVPNVVRVETQQKKQITISRFSDGKNGLNNFELWLVDNPGGTMEQFWNSQKGADGNSPEIDPETGNWFIAGIDTGIKAGGEKGNDGISPEIDPNTGNWFVAGVDTGVKAKGDAGLDAYMVAVANGFNGTVAQWLISLKANNDLEDSRSRNNKVFGNIDANGNKIINSANGTSAQDLVTVNQMAALETTLRTYAEALSVSSFKLLGDHDFGTGSYPVAGVGSGTGGALRRGDAYRHNGATVTFHGMTVNYGDIFYVVNVPAGQIDANWSSLDYNQQQAIETAAGVAKIILASEAANENSTNDTDILTAKKWWQNTWLRVLALPWVWTARQTLATLRLSGIAAGSMVKLNANKDVVAAVADTDFATPALVNGKVQNNMNGSSLIAPSANAVIDYTAAMERFFVFDGANYTVTGIGIKAFKYYLIPANTWAVGTRLRFNIAIEKTGSTANSNIVQMVFNTSAATGGVGIASLNATNTVGNIFLEVIGVIKPGNIMEVYINTTTTAGQGFVAGTITSIVFNPGVDQYFYGAVIPNDNIALFRQSMISIQGLKQAVYLT
ncbi:hypothetical protein FNO01nite_30640 [Flavobacterium noncentrifugens]|uniref:Uncharacterized protein n=1 Tax=Flavobacterium noncentrifugens TaxID=1128970 RepID=A0A1G9BXP4_9FLAO|nr:hypothetical protein [Flavobacterium noncentrifugens]GEP52392.1 hypothetical protein FNO01nite_30640 [Flavobacterium noncentrifugens]SDK43725.1 hypothetical protein SAMN04487935_3378 [Flavobacterium noncentrifugens]